MTDRRFCASADRKIVRAVALIQAARSMLIDAANQDPDLVDARWEDRLLEAADQIAEEAGVLARARDVRQRVQQ